MCLFVQGNDAFCTTHQPHPQIPKTHLVTLASQGTAHCHYPLQDNHSNMELSRAAGV